MLKLKRRFVQISDRGFEMFEDERQRLVRMIYTLANVLVLSNFLMFNAVIEPSRKTFSLTVISWTVFIAVLISVNVWLYFSYYKKTVKPAKN